MNLNDQDGPQLVRLARIAIENYLARNAKIAAPDDITKRYNEKAGAFVTLTTFRSSEEELRGCIGFPMPEKLLYDAIIDAAISSATDDPRFNPVTEKELEELAIEVSVLTEPQLIVAENRKHYKDMIKVGRDGLIVHWRYGSGLLLPQVPVEYKWDPERFLCETCMKAGAMPDCWLDGDTKLFRFEAIVFKELAPKGKVVRVDLGGS